MRIRVLTDDEAKAEMRARDCSVEIIGTWKNHGPAEKRCGTKDFVIFHEDTTFSAARWVTKENTDDR